MSSSTSTSPTSRARVSRLKDAQLLRLASYLHAPERGRSTMPIDAAHGLICAVACGPVAIAISKWLSSILGDGHVFPSVEMDREITALLVQLFESTSHELERGAPVAILVNNSLSGPEQFRDWAEGFLLGVALSEPPWHELVGAEGDFAWMMFPFFALAGRQDDIAAEAGYRRLRKEEESVLLREISECLGTHLVLTRHYWAQAMRTRRGGVR